MGDGAWERPLQCHTRLWRRAPRCAVSVMAGPLQVCLPGYLKPSCNCGRADAIALLQLCPELGRDQVYFFCDSSYSVVPEKIITVLRLLFHMRVPVIFDEFQDLGYELAMKVKVCLKPAYTECSLTGQGCAACLVLTVMPFAGLHRAQAYHGGSGHHHVRKC